MDLRVTSIGLTHIISKVRLHRWALTHAAHIILVSAVTVCTTIAHADPILPELPGPKVGSIVYTGGILLQNNSAQAATDVRAGFRIPRGFGENINQLGLGFVTTGAIAQFEVAGNQFSSQFDDHFLLRNFTVPSNGVLQVSALVDSRRENGLKWLRSLTLTGPGQVPLDTLKYAGGFTARSESPLTYTFSNDGDTLQRIERIALGRSPSLIDPQNFSLSVLDDLTFLNNSGQGWSLAPDDEISFTVPFDVPNGSFLVADIVGTGLPPAGTSTANSNGVSLHYVQQHEAVPEPSSLALLLTGLAALFALAKRKRTDRASAAFDSVFHGYDQWVVAPYGTSEVKKK
jgi:hypothetical protein